MPQAAPRGPAWWALRVAGVAALAVAAGALAVWLRPHSPPPVLTIRPATSFVGMECDILVIERR